MYNFFGNQQYNKTQLLLRRTLVQHNSLGLFKYNACKVLMTLQALLFCKKSYVYTSFALKKSNVRCQASLAAVSL